MKKCPRLRTLLVTVPFYLTVKVLLFIGKVFHLSYNAVNIIIWYMIKLTPTSRVKTFVCNFTAVCAKWTRVGKKMVSKRSCCIIQLFFVLCRHLSQRWCNFVDKIIKDGTLGGVSRSCEIWRSPQEFLPKVWRLTQFFLLLRVGMAAAVAAVADNARMSCRHEQANRFCKLKSGKLKRRKNANLFERVCTIIWCGFLFHISFSTGFTRA